MAHLLLCMQGEESIFMSQGLNLKNIIFFQDCKTTFEGAKNFYSVEGMPICGACAGVSDD